MKNCDMYGENLEQRPWISIADQLPRNKSCVEYASHQGYGLANWSDDKGFHEVFITLGPNEEAEYNKDCAAWNGEIMWWREICEWPYYGTRGYDAETMKHYDVG
jgi:hypothetical protein